jgi:uncharacterized membrane protein YdjX (TVP38/TMEM64 family)
MKGYPLVLTGLMIVLVGIYLVVDAAAVPMLTDPVPILSRSGGWAGVIGVGLLVVDVFLPVPSSLVMVAHGALFGVWGGAAFSVAGGTMATGVGFWVGRHSRRLLQRWTTPRQRARADHLLRKWGWLAVVLTRPVPVLAETVALLAGTSSVRWRTVLVAAVLGYLVPAVAYAWAGSMAGSVVEGVLVFAGVLVLAALMAVVVALSKGWRKTREAAEFTADDR